MEGLNIRDFTVADVEINESITLFVPTLTEATIGRASFDKDGDDYVNAFPDVRHTKIQTFGQGNLACTQGATEGTPKGSLCFVAVFQGGSIAELYEFWSDARVDG